MHQTLHDLIWWHGRFLGITWTYWKVIGWMGNVTFSSRFYVQWYATEKLKRVVVPVAFWWLSLSGSLLLLIYALSRNDSVFIFANLFSWLPYTRNLIIHSRHQKAHTLCTGCQATITPLSKFCSNCGQKV